MVCILEVYSYVRATETPSATETMWISWSRFPSSYFKFFSAWIHGSIHKSDGHLSMEHNAELKTNATRQLVKSLFQSLVKFPDRIPIDYAYSVH